MNKHILNVTLIIPTYSRPERLLKTVQSFFMQDSLPSEIIIVDQSETEQFNKAENELKQFNGYGCNIVHHYFEQKSITAARNEGIKMAKNDIIIFSDDDIDLYDDILKKVESRMADTKICLLAAYDKSFTVNKKMSFRQFLSSFYYLNTFFNFKKGKVLKSIFGHIPPYLNKPVVSEWAMGFFFVIRKSLIIDNNLEFDEKLTKYSYAEDLDFTFRYCRLLKKKGYRGFFDNNLVVNHAVSKEYREPNPTTYLKVFVNRRYLSNKFFGNGMVQRIRLNISNHGYLKMMKNSRDYPFIKKAYEQYKKSIKQIDAGLDISKLYN